MSAGAAAALAHDRALADWIEAEAIVASLRRAVAAAVERAAERARDAAMLQRAGRSDAFAAGVADAARVLELRALEERRRLELAVRAEAALKARVVAARAALSGLHRPIEAGAGASCG